MKIIFTIDHLINRGGKERILVNKANYMAQQWNFDIIIATTSQKNRPIIYQLSPQVKHIDLDINYEDFYKPNVLLNYFSQRHCVKKHRSAIKALLKQEQPDIIISMFGREMVWLGKLKDHSKKILEYHFSHIALKQFASQHFLYRLKCWLKIRAIHDYDLFVVLTEEEKKTWGKLKNIIVMPNALPFYPQHQANLKTKRILSVGRLSQEKGFDRLISIWGQIVPKFPQWKLSIVGDGKEYKNLIHQIENLGLNSSIELLPSTPDILSEYLNSSIYALTSYHEGFAMVLIEAMACGLPTIAYSCQYGPSQLITNNEDGFLIPDGDSQTFVSQLSLLMSNEQLRLQMGKSARQNVLRFSEEKIMTRWREIYERLITPQNIQ